MNYIFIIIVTTTSLNSYGKVLSSISKIKKSYELQKEKRSLLNYSPEENNNFNQNFSNLPNKILQEENLAQKKIPHCKHQSSTSVTNLKLNQYYACNTKPKWIDLDLNMENDTEEIMREDYKNNYVPVYHMHYSKSKTDLSKCGYIDVNKERCTIEKGAIPDLNPKVKPHACSFANQDWNKLQTKMEKKIGHGFKMKNIINDINHSNICEQKLKHRKDFEININMENVLHLELVISNLREELKNCRTENSQLKLENENLKKELEEIKSNLNKQIKLPFGFQESNTKISSSIDEDEQFERDEYLAKQYEENFLKNRGLNHKNLEPKLFKNLSKNSDTFDNDNKMYLSRAMRVGFNNNTNLNSKINSLTKNQSDKRLDRTQTSSLDNRNFKKCNKGSFNDNTAEIRIQMIPNSNKRRYTSKTVIQYNNDSTAESQINKPLIKEINVLFADLHSFNSICDGSVQDLCSKYAGKIEKEKFNFQTQIKNKNAVKLSKTFNNKNKIYKDNEVNNKRKEFNSDQKSKNNEHK